MIRARSSYRGLATVALPIAVAIGSALLTQGHAQPAPAGALSAGVSPAGVSPAGATPASASPAGALPAGAPPTAVAAALGDARLAGEGALRWFGLRIYEARLWVGADGIDPARLASSAFALDLRYARALAGEAIARRSHEEIARLGYGDPQRRDAWLDAMRRIFPDVADGDRLTGVHRPGAGVSFYRNDRRIGRVDDPEFGAAFFAIWLDARTSAPQLRDRLLAGAGLAR